MWHWLTLTTGKLNFKAFKKYFVKKKKKNSLTVCIIKIYFVRGTNALFPQQNRFISATRKTERLKKKKKFNHFYLFFEIFVIQFAVTEHLRMGTFYGNSKLSGHFAGKKLSRKV